MKLLDIYIDDIYFLTQVNKLVCSGFFELRQIKSTHRCLPADAEKSFSMRSWYRAWTTITVSMPTYHKRSLIEYSRSAALLIFGASRFSHVTPLLSDRLHWFQCPERKCYKLCVTVFKALHGMAPDYIADLCLPKVISERRSMLLSASTSGVRLAVPRRSSFTRVGAGLFVWRDQLLGAISLKALD